LRQLEPASLPLMKAAPIQQKYAPSAGLLLRSIRSAQAELHNFRCTNPNQFDGCKSITLGIPRHLFTKHSSDEAPSMGWRCGLFSFRRQDGLRLGLPGKKMHRRNRYADPQQMHSRRITSVRAIEFSPLPCSNCGSRASCFASTATSATRSGSLLIAFLSEMKISGTCTPIAFL